MGLEWSDGEPGEKERSCDGVEGDAGCEGVRRREVLRPQAGVPF